MANNGGSFMQNNRTSGQAIDTFVGNPGTFDVSTGIDIHNALNGITLAPMGNLIENVEAVECYLTYDENNLYRFTYDNNTIIIRNSDNVIHSFGTQEHTILMNGSQASSINDEFPTRPRNAVRLGDDIYILCEHRVYKYDPVANTHERMEVPERSDPNDLSNTAPIIPAIQYHETLIIVGKGNKVFTYEPIGGRTKAREFKRGVISGMILFNENVGVVSNEGHDTMIYVIGGNFEAEDIGVLQYIPLPGMSVTNIAQKGGRLFVLCTDLIDGGHTEFYEIRGSTPILIKETRDGSQFLYDKTTAGKFVLDQEIPSVGNRIIITTSDGIRVYGSPNSSIPEGSYYLEDYIGLPKSNHAHGQYFFLSHSGGRETRYYMGQDSNRKVYQEVGSLVTRQFFGREQRTIKSMIMMFISFYRPVNSRIDLYIRKNLSVGREFIISIDGTNDLETISSQTMSRKIENAFDTIGDRNTCSIEIVLVRGPGEQQKNVTPVVYEVGAIYEHHSL